MKKLFVLTLAVFLICASMGYAEEVEEQLCDPSEPCCQYAMGVLEACYQNTDYYQICESWADGQYYEFENFCWTEAIYSIDPGVCIVWPDYCYSYLNSVYAQCMGEWYWWRYIKYAQCVSEWGSFLLAYTCQQAALGAYQSCPL